MLFGQAIVEATRGWFLIVSPCAMVRLRTHTGCFVFCSKAIAVGLDENKETSACQPLAWYLERISTLQVKAWRPHKGKGFGLRPT